jgi:hypothetical protein
MRLWMRLQHPQVKAHDIDTMPFALVRLCGGGGI